MFDSEIENKIIDFVKKSPIGVTSSEIAKYLHINRITLTKYLAVIKEKALLDFKQFGMAKIWYIPVNFNKEVFFSNLLVDVAKSLNEEERRSIISKAGMNMAKEIERMYKSFYNVEKLNTDQVIEAFMDAERKLGANFTILERTKDRLIFQNNKCPFGHKGKECPDIVTTVTSNILGTLVGKNFGYAKVIVRRAICKGDTQDEYWVYLRKTEESEKEKATEFYPTE